jgi:ADP-ribose pyrophosphatase YjhB (NUDIX family)
MDATHADFDYHGALAVVETDDDEIVFIHPPGAPHDFPGSLPSDPCDAGEEPINAAVRIVREKTGLEVTILREFITLIQEGTLTGTMCAHGYVARITGGELLVNGPEGFAKAYPLDDLPCVVPVRVANQRTLDAHLELRATDQEA